MTHYPHWSVRGPPLVCVYLPFHPCFPCPSPYLPHLPWAVCQCVEWMHVLVNAQTHTLTHRHAPPLKRIKHWQQKGISTFSSGRGPMKGLWHAQGVICLEGILGPALPLTGHCEPQVCAWGPSSAVHVHGHPESWAL